MNTGADGAPVDGADVCVVGAGQAAALAAGSLAERGHAVVVLAAGRRVGRTRVERLKRRASPAASADGGPVAGAPGAGGRRDGVAPRYRQADFELESRCGVGRDWPVSYEDLRPYYAEAERRLGVAGDADAPFQPPRDGPFPGGAPPSSGVDRLFAAAADELDVTLHPVPGVGPADRADGPERVGRRWTAGAGGPGRVAERDGVTVVEGASVRRLEHGPDGERVTAAVYRTPRGGTHRQAADAFVTACGAVETVRLLSRSASEAYPNGLANGSGTLGRYLLARPRDTVVGVLDEPTGGHHRSPAGFGTLQFADPTADRAGLSVILCAGATPAEVALETDGWGDRLLDEVEFAYGDTVRATAGVGCLPRADNRVRLDTGTDGGVRFTPGRFARRARERARAVGREVIEQLGGVVAPDATAGGGGPPGGTCLLGGARMGVDPAGSVVDPHLRAHDLSNLSVGGWAPFVTASGVDPFLTVAALSLKAAEGVDDRL